MRIVLALDYDSTTKSYSFDVTVSDGAHTLLVPITVIVNAVNEFTPNFTTVVTETVAENVAVGTEITTFTAVDNDHSPHDIVSYSITSGEANMVCFLFTGYCLILRTT